MPSSSAQSVSRNTLCAALLLLHGACSETIVLGTECPDSLGRCDNDAALDAAEPAPEDARVEPPPDAEPPDAGALVTIGNGSFELRSNPMFVDPESQYGSDVWVNTTGGIVPVAGGLFANLDPWFACLPTAAQAVRELSGFQATEGTGFVTTNALLLGSLAPGIHQRLTTPLQAGQPYAFQIDVLAPPGSSNVKLQLGAGTQPCAASKSSATSALIAEGAWQTLCMTITPREPLVMLDLVPSFDGLPTGTLAFDNIRSVTNCP